MNEKTMKIAISISSEEPDACFDTRFGRATAFYFIDLETDTRQIVTNPGVSASGGAGIQTAQFVAKLGVGVVISGAFGPKAFDALEAAGIQMLVPPDKAGMTIPKILSLYKMGELETVSARRLDSVMATRETLPLVVLDVPAPAARSELLRQLVLRNAFAAEWTVSSRVPPAAILATGLAGSESRYLLIRQLVQLLSEELPIGEVATRIRGLYLDNRAEFPPISSVGTALFTVRPEQVFCLRRLKSS